MKTDCLKIYIRHRKVYLSILGFPLEKLLKNYGLVYEILKTIGHQMNIEDFKEPGDISGVCVEQDYPDYIVEVKNGNIKVVDFI